MTTISMILGLSIVASLVGCDQNKDRGPVTVDAPGVKVDTDKTGNRQTTVDAPGVKVESGADGTHVRAPGADVDVNKK